MNRNLLDGVALRPEVRVRQLIRLCQVQIFEFHLHVHHALDLVTLKVKQDEEKERDLRARETGRACERQKIPIRARAVLTPIGYTRSMIDAYASHHSRVGSLAHDSVGCSTKTSPSPTISSHTKVLQMTVDTPESTNSRKANTYGNASKLPPFEPQRCLHKLYMRVLDRNIAMMPIGASVVRVSLV